MVVQDPINKLWQKYGTIKISRPMHTGQRVHSYHVKTDDGKTYLRNTRFLTRAPVSEPLAERE